MVRDRAAAVVRRRRRLLERQARYEAGKVVGLAQARISINADRGIVVLRGVLESDQEIRRVEEQVRGVPAVHDVQNLLHLPGTPAPASRPRGVRPPADTTA
jgi:osmotically-inducible protein OsmY